MNTRSSGMMLLSKTARMNWMNELTVISCRQCPLAVCVYCRRCIVELSAVPPRPPASPVTAKSGALVRSAERGIVADLLRPTAAASTLSSRGWRRAVDRDDPSWWCRVDGGGAELDVEWGGSPTPRWPDAPAGADEEEGAVPGRDVNRRSDDAARDDDTGPAAAAAAAGWRQSAGTYPRRPPSSSA